MNTFQAWEPETFAALNEGKVLNGLPPVLAVGPLEPYEYGQGPWLSWVDAQPSWSVMYVSFGRRTVLSKDQNQRVGWWFGEERVQTLVDSSVTVDSNSATEAAWHGVPVLAWPQHGDQKLNASVAESNGLGSWEESWEWGGEEVKGEEIVKRIRE
ncbi:UDP-glycosyltransferase 708G1-like [Macadamia integrifolia]|uniref:UDP-glycosyltransferase 708G1-like n=1 Tax=Macadamia integrifolia TaxID=60698 RepID=UPI001C4FFD8D|nr:UDP-glycosyltransferase 708G1-like [Macadamia integrifolia]